ncbi:amino acid deaminase [Photobacterium sp. CCB-ST2H9]|uniref:amino acid deaminase n=1 Tax=Photobacterium sp. CCB-ST2H9 TaxID=2912855 RepID=UPI002002C215|nr:amino acid deaminase [Photobacterium sp. CCB-ST2H9]UTM58340.1 amino acid deaminase [Photobacterium sp. CCB-ST2H9]
MPQANKKHVSKYQEFDHKNFPIGTKGVWVHEKSEGRYSLIDEEICLPAAVLRESAIHNNLNWMQQFANHHQVKLSPHGKTTMTPSLFTEQLQAGAWGITVATPAQAETAAVAGAQNILMANQLVGKANMALIARLIRQHDVRFYCCVDSCDNAAQLSRYFSAEGLTLNVLIEYGVPGGRCGCRNHEEAETLAGFIQAAEGLSLHGIEVYEGVIHGADAEDHIRLFLRDAVLLAEQLTEKKLITVDHPIVTGAGSAWYDIVAEEFAGHPHLNAVIRPGCYLIHDTGIYQDAQHQVIARAKANQGYACELGGDLESALELWAYVLSVPEPCKAVIGMGKRDVAFDAGLPIVERGFRDGQPITVSGLEATAIMDQHTFVNVPAGTDLRVGDILVFSTSHPCLTFDKWRYLCITDDTDTVGRFVDTRF